MRDFNNRVALIDVVVSGVVSADGSPTVSQVPAVLEGKTAGTAGHRILQRHQDQLGRSRRCVH